MRCSASMLHTGPYPALSRPASSPSGRTSATRRGEPVTAISAAFARMEQRLIGQRTKDAMAAKKAGGQRLGRRFGVPEDVQERIAAAHETGVSMARTARDLTAEGSPRRTAAPVSRAAARAHRS